MSERQRPDHDDAGWIDFPPRWPEGAGGARDLSQGAGGQPIARGPVVVASPIRPLGGGMRRRVVRITAGGGSR